MLLVFLAGKVTFRANPKQKRKTHMNRYQIFTRSGREFSVAASNSDRAMAIVLEKTGEKSSCWFISNPSKWAVALN
jgi:hypothetical protein